MRELLDYLATFAPLSLAESWDNVGLLIGDESAAVQRVLTCLTLTPDVAEEALSLGVNLVIAHHPVLFRPVQRLTTATVEGAMLLRLIQGRVAVYSPHTAFDSSELGINAWLATQLGLVDVQPLRRLPNEVNGGGGRFGRLKSPAPLNVFLDLVARKLKVKGLQYVGDRERRIATVGIACGAAGDYLADAAAAGCDLFLTGETRFHTCLEARSLGIALVLAGHFATERPAVEWLASHLAEKIPRIEFRPSRVEADPIQWF